MESSKKKNILTVSQLRKPFRKISVHFSVITFLRFSPTIQHLTPTTGKFLSQHQHFDFSLFLILGTSQNLSWRGGGVEEKMGGPEIF